MIAKNNIHKYNLQIFNSLNREKIKFGLKYIHFAHSFVVT